MRVERLWLTSRSPIAIPPLSPNTSAPQRHLPLKDISPLKAQLLSVILSPCDNKEQQVLKVSNIKVKLAFLSFVTLWTT